MQRHWYALHTYSGHENKVMTNILRRAEMMSLQSKIFRILVPTEPEMTTRNGKKVEVKRKDPRARQSRDGFRRSG